MTLYLDWNATTPPLAEVLDVMRLASERAWGNPASVHRHGAFARSAMEQGRASIAALFGVDVRDVLLTSGGTEANNMALRSGMMREGRLLLSRLEHPSVTRVAESMPAARVRWVNVTRAGQIDLDDLEQALGEPLPVALVSLQAANHETGVLQPMGNVFDLLRPRGIPLHSDTVQVAGKSPLLWPEACYRVLAAHKIRGPKGLGALVTRQGVPLSPVLYGGAQERGLRPGTVDASACAGVAEAVARISTDVYEALRGARDTLEQRVLACAPKGSFIAGADAPRLPHVSNIVMPGVASPELVAALDIEGISVSAGSACSAGTVEPSPVLHAMFGPELAGSGLRISLGPTLTPADFEHAANVFKKVLARF
jgi:cysteine desulfurase